MNPLRTKANTTKHCLLIRATVVAALAFAVETPALSAEPKGGNSFNTAYGFEALFNDTTGQFNTAIGTQALFDNTVGESNTAVGAQTLLYNTSGNQNTAVGTFALVHNNASNNTANGFQALLSNTTGTQNTATGESALKNNTTANNNTADGYQAQFHNTTGTSNTAMGYHSLFNNNTGSSNIGLGANAGANLTTGSNNIDIGSGGVAGEANTLRIGSLQTRAFIKGVSGVAIAGATVVVNAAGQLGVAPSSAHFKQHIRPMDKESETILGLKPVSFCYQPGIDEEALPQFGLIAEDVEKVNPDLVVRDDAGQPYSVRYDQVNAMLLNEFLKQHQKVEQQARQLQQQTVTISELKNRIAAVTAQLNEQAARIQKITARLETSAPVIKLVNVEY